MRLKTWDRFSVYINLINYARSNGNNSYSKTQITFSKIFYKSATHAVRWSKWIRVKTAMKKWWICFLCSLSWEGGENEKMQRKNIGKSLDSRFCHIDMERLLQFLLAVPRQLSIRKTPCFFLLSQLSQK